MNALLQPPLVQSHVLPTTAGARALTVVAKLTYTLAPGEPCLAPSQEPVAPREFVAPRPRVDVIVVGSAYAPKGQPAWSVVARVVVGEIDKRIQCTQPRVWSPEGPILTGPPRTQFSLAPENAAASPENPEGVRSDRPNANGVVAIPTLLPPQFALRRGEPIPSVSYGPIADKLAPNWAPLDQRLNELRDNEQIMLENLNPDHPRLVTCLPGVRLYAFHELRGEPRRIAMRLDTLWIDTDRQVFTLTWRGASPVSTSDVAGRVLVAHGEPGWPIEWEEMCRLAVQQASTPTKGRAADAASTTPIGSESPPPPHPSAPKNERSVAAAAAGTMLAIDESIGGRALPFLPKPPPPVPPPPAPTGKPESPWLENRGQSAPPVSPIAAPREGAWQVPFEPSANLPTPPSDLGVLGVSNDAARRAAVEPPIARPVAAPGIAAVATETALDLLWYDPACISRLRRTPSFREVLEDAESEPADFDVDGDDDDASDRHDVYQVIARSPSTALGNLASVVADATRPTGKFAPPLLVLGCDVELLFDDVERLKALVAIIRPLVGLDAELRGLVETAQDALKMVEAPLPAIVAADLSSKLREAFSRSRRNLRVDDVADRVLLERRAYRRQTVFGAVLLRARITDGSAHVFAYFDESLAPRFPLSTTFSGRLIAEAHLGQDPEDGRYCLRPVAVARGLSTSSMRSQ